MTEDTVLTPTEDPTPHTDLTRVNVPPHQDQKVYLGKLTGNHIRLSYTNTHNTQTPDPTLIVLEQESP